MGRRSSFSYYSTESNLVSVCVYFGKSFLLRTASLFHVGYPFWTQGMHNFVNTQDVDRRRFRTVHDRPTNKDGTELLTRQ